VRAALKITQHEATPRDCPAQRGRTLASRTTLRTLRVRSSPHRTSGLGPESLGFTTGEKILRQSHNSCRRHLTRFFHAPEWHRGSITECLFLLRSLTTSGVPTASRCVLIFSLTRVSAAIVVGSKRRCYKEIMNSKFSVADLSDAQLISEVKARAARECDATAALVASLAELDERRLYLGEGCASLFTYCTQVLHLSEHAAYGRIEAARAARRFPILLDLLAEGAVTLTNVCLIAPLLTTENHHGILDAIRHKSKREVEHLVAALRPRPPVPPVVRKLPPPKSAEALRTAPETLEARPAVEVSADVVVPLARRPTVAPLAPEQYKVQVTVNAETHKKLRRAQDLLRHVIPNGDPAQIFDRALTLLVAELEEKKLAAATRPRGRADAPARSRHIPAAVKREVWKRDEGRCAFVGRNGRCTERGFLEFHHVVPYADGGATTADNLQLRCRAHNAYESERHFGPLWVRERAERGSWTRSGTTLSDPSTSSGRAGSTSAAAPHAGKSLAARTLSVPRRLRMPVDDTCQAHRCAGRAVGIYADHTARSRREESPRALSGCALRRRAPHRVGRRPRSPAARGRRRRASRSPRPRTRVTRDRSKARPQRDGRAGLGTEAPQRAGVRVGGPAQRGSRTTLRRARFSTRRPREQERDARRRRPWSADLTK
jgi:hypothetical protein